MKDLNSLLMEYLKPAIGGSNDLNPDSPDLENIISIEKQNLLLTCYKNIAETDVKKYQQTNKILKCDNFFDKGKINDMLMPKYREWIKIFNFK